MIIGIVSTIFSSLGIYGFFTGNLLLLYLGMAFVIFEYIIGIVTGESKGGLITIVFPFILGLMIGGMNWLQAIAICLCFEGTISFILGLILMLFVGVSIKKENKA